MKKPLPKGITKKGLQNLMKGHLPGLARGAWHEKVPRTRISSIARADGGRISEAKNGHLMLALDSDGRVHTYSYTRGDLAPELTRLELPKKHQEFVYREIEKKRGTI